VSAPARGPRGVAQLSVIAASNKAVAVLERVDIAAHALEVDVVATVIEDVQGRTGMATIIVRVAGDENARELVRSYIQRVPNVIIEDLAFVPEN
jgi:hypothetical protein